MAEVYTLKIVYIDCDERIWREAQVSSNNTLASIGYMVLATFDTLAYHLFNISYNGTTFELPNEDFEIGEDECLFYVKFSQLKLKVDDKLGMLYDFGCEQCFDIEIVDIQPMPKGSGRAYPKITDGEGKGILDDTTADETLETIKETDKKGKSTHTYLTRYEDECLWDYRDFDLKYENIMLKGVIKRIAEGYEVFDEYM
ncbi:MAG: plasmid pRiA4b ORF-3 family protein [Ruminococcaceae bacterium]|nr:plasmid pRiA4b ORF-3 family protein [Oscillospiraceae bacterium]